MGGTVSKDQTTIVKKIATDFLAQTITNCQSISANDIAIEAKANVVKIKDLKASQFATVKIDCAVTELTKSTVANDLADKIKQYAESKGQAIVSALGRTRSDVISDLKTDLTNAFKSIQVTDIKASLTNTTKITATASGDSSVFDLEDAKIDQGTSTVAKSIVSISNVTAALTKAAEELTQTTKSEEENPIAGIFKAIGDMLTGPIVAALAVIVVLIILVIIVKKMF